MRKIIYEVIVYVNDTELAKQEARDIALDLYNMMFVEPHRVAYFRDTVSTFIADRDRAEVYLTALLVRLESAGIAVGDSRIRSLGIQGE
jgi:hypothetical protein